MLDSGTGGRSVADLSPAARWIDIPYGCNDCGCGLQVSTRESDGCATDGDPVRCPFCGADGHFNSDAEGVYEPLMNYLE